MGHHRSTTVRGDARAFGLPLSGPGGVRLRFGARAADDDLDLLSRHLPVDPLADASHLLRSGRSTDASAILESFVADPASSDADRTRAWLLAAEAHGLDGDHEAAITAADRAAALAARVGDGAADVEANLLRAMAYQRLGLFTETLEVVATALAEARARKLPRLEALALRLMSNHSLREGDEHETRRLLEQSLVCARRAHDDEGAFWALNNLSNLLGIQAARLAAGGERAAAGARVADLVRIVREAMAVAHRTGHWLHLAFAISNLADASIVQGDHRRARELVAEYAGLAREHGSSRLLAYANLDEVRMRRAEGRLDEAAAVIDGDAHRRLLSGNDDLALETETALYELHKERGRFEQALRHHERASQLQIEWLTRRSERQVGVILARIDMEHLRRVAHEDELTGTGNRRAADEALARRLDEPTVDREPLHIALVDIDHFKVINDTHGHATGDAVLATIGRLMRQALRSRDQVFRYGGEEFLLLLPDTAPDTGREVCERLREAIEAFEWHTIAPDLAVTASFGVARLTDDERAAPLVHRADTALYAAKRDGRNRVTVA